MADIQLPAPSSGGLPRQRARGDVATLNAGDVPIARSPSDPGVAVPKGAFSGVVDEGALAATEKGLDTVGSDIYRAGLRQQKLQDANATTQARLAYDTTTMTEWNRRQIEDDPSRPDFMKDYNDWLGQQAQSSLASLPKDVSPEARARFQLTLAEKQHTLAEAAGRVSLQAGQDKAIDLIGQQSQQWGAQVARDPQLLDAVLADVDKGMAAYAGTLTPNKYRDADRKVREHVVQSALSGYVQQGKFGEAYKLLGTTQPSPDQPSQGGGAVAISPDARLATVNNNPGNLKFVGQSGATMGESGFAKFATPEDGYAALRDQIELDASRGLTLAGYVSKAAPPSENDTAGYTRAAVKALGVGADTLLRDIPTDKVAAFVARQESGTIVSPTPRAAPQADAMTLPASPGGPGKYDTLIDVAKASHYVQTQQHEFDARARADLARSQQATEADASVKVERGQLDNLGIDDLRASKQIDDRTWARLTIQRDAIAAAEAEQARLTERGMLFGRGLTADPKSKDDKKSIDLAFDAVSSQWKDLSPSDQLDRGVAFSVEKGMVPEPLKSTIRGGLHSGSADQAVMAADTVKRLRNANPALIADIGDPNDLRLANSIGAYTDAGMPAAVAVQRAMEGLKVSKVDQEAREADYDLQRGKTKADQLASDKGWIEGKQNGWFQLDPNVEPVMAAEFNEMAKLEYGRTGNLEAARQTALDTINRSWGRTRVGGDFRYMKYAPEKFYGVPTLDDSGNAKWMNEQLVADVSKGALTDPSNPITADRLLLMPDPTRQAQDGRPVYRVALKGSDGSYYAVADSKGAPVAWFPDWNTSAEKKRIDDAQASGVASAKAVRARVATGEPIQATDYPGAPVGIP